MLDDGSGRVTKRARKNDDGNGTAATKLRNGSCLCLDPRLQKFFPEKYYNESEEFIAALFNAGLLSRAQTIKVTARVGGDSFDIRLDANKSTVGEAKGEVERQQGIKKSAQEMYRGQKNPDGSNVREFDGELELLDNMATLANGDFVVLVVKNIPTPQWRTFSKDHVKVIEDGLGVICVCEDREFSLTHTGESLMGGRHYWEVTVFWQHTPVVLGLVRPYDTPRYLRTEQDYADNTNAWMMDLQSGRLWGNGESGKVRAGRTHSGDRIGVLVDLDEGSLRFFKNGKQLGPGYPADSVRGPVALGVQLVERWEFIHYGHHGDTGYKGHKVLLNQDAEWPDGHTQ